MGGRTRLLGVLCWCVACAACSSSEKEAAPGAPPSADHAEHPAATGAAPAVVAPAGAKVFFLEPADGKEVKGASVDGKVTVNVKMGTDGITVQPAGQQVTGTGHHHILIDAAPIPIGEVVPKDETHLHFGQGQTDVQVPLTPGEHTLTLQFADGAHLSYGPQLASTIKLEVVADPTAAAPAQPAAPAASH